MGNISTDTNNSAQDMAPVPTLSLKRLSLNDPRSYLPKEP